MAKYNDILTSINNFLVSYSGTNEFSIEMFEGIFIKKLSNSNIVYRKKYINVATGNRTHQSHLDLVGQDTLCFFFGNNPDTNDVYKQITLDIPVNNLSLLKAIDLSEESIDSRGPENTLYRIQRRQSFTPVEFPSTNHHFVEAFAFKKLIGHLGEQNQINRLKNHDAFFDLISYSFENDYLVMLKYNTNHYICLVIPTELASEEFQKLVSSVNFTINNSHFSIDNARKEYVKIVKDNLTDEFNNLNSVIENTTNGLEGTDKEQLVKTRIGQGSFRKLLIEKRGCECQLCSINLPEVLRASHIQSWSKSSPEERMDIENGLLLCANHDALFDRHLISFDSNNYGIKISSSIPNNQIHNLYLDQTKQIIFSERMKLYMKKHYSLFEQ